MKSSQQDIETILRRERRERKRRRKAEAQSRESDSVTPPRNPPSYLADDDLGFDESSIPPEQARKRDEDRFNDRLRDELEADMGVGYYEDLLYEREAAKAAAAFSYGGAAGVAMGVGSKSGLEAMGEEEYAEHVRAGMWRRKNKDEAERLERVEQEKKKKLDKENEELERLRKLEKERIRKLEEVAKKRNVKEEKEARIRYEENWKKILLKSKEPTPAAAPPPAPSEGEPVVAGPQLPPPPPPNSLRFTDFPWPLHPPAPLPPLSWPKPSDITPTSISSFLLSGVEPTARKATLRTAVLAYHPDRFDRLVERVPEENEPLRERVKELGLRVSQTLNDLMKATGSAA